MADDGSEDHTPQVVEQFARSVDFPVHFTTHPHVTHEVARCRNDGAALTTAPYLLFLDGDCVLPPDHVAMHLKHRRRGFAAGADCCRLDRETSERITDDVIRSGEFVGWIPRSERRRLNKRARKAWLYEWIGHPTKPKLIGNNIAVWRDDFERLNGFDEKFQGWGCEDDDLRLRLRQDGVRIKSIIRWTITYHIWHRTDPTAPKTRWRDGANAKYIVRPFRLTRCLKGLEKQPVERLPLRVVGSPAQQESVERLLGKKLPQNGAAGRAEVEMLVVPGDGGFSGRANCNVLVVLEDSPAAARLARKAHVVVSDQKYPGVDEQFCFKLDDFDGALRAVA